MSREPSGIEKTLAAVGVIVSLLFVGYEIRQNTNVARAAAIQATADQILQWQAEAAHDDEWIRISTFLATGGTFDELSAEDRTRYTWVVSATVRIMENRFRQVQLGIVDPKDLGLYGGTSNPNWFRSEHMLAWWGSRDQSRSWAPDFLEFFETEVLGIR
jgi:hypothetical protein